MPDPMAPPIIGANFSVSIDGKDLGFFTSCEGMAIEVQVEQREEGGNQTFVHQLPGRLKYTNVKLSRPVSTDTLKVANWISSMAGGVQRTTGEIVARDTMGHPVFTWNLDGVFPLRWTGPAFRSQQADPVTETLELAYESFTLT